MLAGLRTPEGRLRRSWKDGRASSGGVLEDYANLADGLLALYEATFDERWFGDAVALMDVVVERFADPAGGFFDTPDDGERLVVRPKDLGDNATPSGNAMATTVLLRLAALTGEGRYRAAAERALATAGAVPRAVPDGVRAMARARSSSPTQASRRSRSWAPRTIRAPLDSSTWRAAATRRSGSLASTGDPATSVVPLLRDRFALNGRATAFVCRDFACRQPVHEPEALEALLLGA